jgi:hypothetical protein
VVKKLRNSGWGYDRIVGALANLGHAVSDQTVGNILRRYGIQPALKRSQNTTWNDFIASHIRNATDEHPGFLHGQRHLLHDRDAEFCAAFLDVLRSSGIAERCADLRQWQGRDDPR